MKINLNQIIVSFLRLLSLLILICLLWVAWQYLEKPVDLIDRWPGDIMCQKDSVIVADYLPKNRLYTYSSLTTSQGAQINITISTPQKIPLQGLPVVIILGGLEIGTYTLGYISHPGNNIIIIYNYPYHPEYWYSGSAIEEIPVIRSSVMDVPAQVLCLYKWTDEQPWSSTNNISLAGYSFGALFIPAIFHLAQTYSIPLEYGVLAYGGVDIYELLKANLTQIYEPFRSVFSWALFTAIRGVDPLYHAASMRGDFLLINGLADQQIPEKCWRELHRLTPEPKSILILKEGHMHQRKVELTKKLVNLTQDWLLSKKLINP